MTGGDEFAEGFPEPMRGKEALLTRNVFSVFSPESTDAYSLLINGFLTLARDDKPPVEEIKALTIAARFYFDAVQDGYSFAPEPLLPGVWEKLPDDLRDHISQTVLEDPAKDIVRAILFGKKPDEVKS